MHLKINHSRPYKLNVQLNHEVPQRSHGSVGNGESFHS